MAINWTVVATIAAPIIALFVGVILSRAIEDRTRLVTYLGHVSAFSLRDSQGNFMRDAQGNVMQVYTHAVIVRNTGRKPATNVRLGHNILPNFQMYPLVRYEVSDLPDGGKEIVIPTLVPKEQISISYLYNPPTTWNQVNTHIKSDEGFAKVIPVLLAQQFPKWSIRVIYSLLLIGSVALIYMLYLSARWLIWRYQ